MPLGEQSAKEQQAYFDWRSAEKAAAEKRFAADPEGAVLRMLASRLWPSLGDIARQIGVYKEDIVPVVERLRAAGRAEVDAHRVQIVKLPS